MTNGSWRGRAEQKENMGYECSLQSPTQSLYSTNKVSILVVECNTGVGSIIAVKMIGPAT